MTRRGATLIEAVVVIVILALSVPAAVAMLSQSAETRVEAVKIARATLLAEGVLEHVLADVASDEIGFAALDDAGYYMGDPESGLRTRIESFARSYTDLGLSYELDISPLVASDGVETGDPSLDLFRRVEVTVRAPSSTGSPIVLRIETMVGDL